MMQSIIRPISIALVLVVVGLAACAPNDADDVPDDVTTHELLHVGYDIAREIVSNMNSAFIEQYEAENPDVQVEIEQSHAGSTRQARAVAEGLDADLITMNQYLDIELILDESRDRAGGLLVAEDWQDRLPNGASPWSSTMAFVVREGNPENISDWDDLIRDDVEIVAPNYATTGNGRFSYLTAWAFALERFDGDQGQTFEFVRSVVGNTPQFATGGRDATNLFTERNQGDVLVTFESEANFIANELGDYEVVVPSFGINAQAYVATGIVYAEEKGNTEIAEAYWDFVYSREGQEIAARSYNRPYDQEVAAEFSDLLPELELFDVPDVFGGWTEANDAHFGDGGTFEEIIASLGRD